MCVFEKRNKKNLNSFSGRVVEHSYLFEDDLGSNLLGGDFFVVSCVGCVYMCAVCVCVCAVCVYVCVCACGREDEKTKERKKGEKESGEKREKKEKMCFD